MGLYWGNARSNNAAGHLVGHIKVGKPALVHAWNRSSPRAVPARPRVHPPTHPSNPSFPHEPTRPCLQDIGQDPNKPETRLYATNAPQPIHNDGPADVVTLVGGWVGGWAHGWTRGGGGGVETALPARNRSVGTWPLEGRRQRKHGRVLC